MYTKSRCLVSNKARKLRWYANTFGRDVETLSLRVLLGARSVIPLRSNTFTHQERENIAPS